MAGAPDLKTDPDLEAAAEWCFRLAERPLSSEEQAAFETWMAEPNNRRAFEDAVGVWHGLDQASRMPNVLARRRQALRGFELGNRGRWRAGVRRPRLWLAACLALAVVAIWSGRAVQPADFRTGIGERRIVVLADGSKISLDAATEVKVRYTAGKRQLWLEHGRAKFEVAKDVARPFTVAAADKVVRATGTQFSVELLQNKVEVVLYEGHVAVTRSGPDHDRRPVMLRVAGGRPIEADDLLTPGRVLVTPVAAGDAQVAPADPVRSLAWEGGQLVFEREPLDIAVQRVNRYSTEKVTVGDAKAAALRIDGVFSAGDTAAFLEAVAGVFPVRVRDTDEGKVIVSR